MADDRKGWFLKSGVVAEPPKSVTERAKQYWTDTLGTLGRKGEQARKVADERLAALQARLGKVAERGHELSAAAMGELSHWLNAALASASFAGELQAWLIDRFASSSASVYDKAMDAVYNQTHVGGGFHRLFDSGHDVIGAWSACAEAAQQCNDGFSEQVAGYLAALWKDCVTPMGLPVVSLDKVNFDEVAANLAGYGIEKAWLVKMVSVNAENLLGGATGLLSVVLNWNRADSDRFAEMVGSFGVSSIFALNPVIGLVALVCLARAYQQAKMEQDGVTAYRMLLGIGKGGLGSAVFIATMSLLSAHVWVALVVGMCACLLAGKAFDEGRKIAEDADWNVVATFLTERLRAAFGRVEEPMLA